MLILLQFLELTSQLLKKEYIGKIVDVMPQVGTILHIVKPPVNYLILVINLSILVIPVILHVRFRRNTQKISTEVD